VSLPSLRGLVKPLSLLLRIDLAESARLAIKPEASGRVHWTKVLAIPKSNGEERQVQVAGRPHSAGFVILGDSVSCNGRYSQERSSGSGRDQAQVPAQATPRLERATRLFREFLAPSGRALAVGKIRALSDLDDVTIRIANVAANLAVFGDGLRDELGSPTFP